MEMGFVIVQHNLPVGCHRMYGIVVFSKVPCRGIYIVRVIT